MPHEEFFWAAIAIAGVFAVLFFGKVFLQQSDTKAAAKTPRQRSG